MRTIISYEPLWKTLQEKGISQYYLLQNGLDNKTLDSLKKGKNITLLTLEKPLVLDADGINALSEHINLLEKHSGEILLTPHPAEMARLINSDVKTVQQNRQKTASDFAKKYGVTVILKGHGTVIALKDGRVFINPTGNPGMATGGSGDVLSGMLVSFLAQGLSPETAAKAAVYIHGAAGDLAAEKKSQRSMLPSDILNELPRLFLEYEKGGE